MIVQYDQMKGPSSYQTEQLQQQVRLVADGCFQR